MWRVEKGKRKCDSDSDGHIDLTRFVAPNGEGCVGDCIINGIISTPDPGNSTFDVPIFPSCTSNVKIEDHGWASLYLSSDFKPELGCGCGNWVDIPDNIKGACPSIGSAEVAFNNNGYECLIFDDDGKKIYP